LKDDNTIRKSIQLARMVQKLKNDKNRDDSLLFSWAHYDGGTFHQRVLNS